MIVFDSPYLQIRFDAEMQAIVEDWKLDFTVQVEGDTFRQPLEKALQAITEHKATKWLCDNTERKAVKSPDQLWLEKTYYTELHKRGIKTVALVNGKDVLQTYTAKNHLQSVSDRNITIEIFNKRRPAMEWLKQN
jgi:inner membrane protein involved in colicin E2 resistance